MTKLSVLTLILLSACFIPVAQPAGGGTGPSSSGSTASGEPSYASSSDPYPSSSAPRSTASQEPARAAAPAAPTTVSVTIRSACSKTVKVFYGEKPGYSSGTQSSISSNSVQSKTFRPGDRMWVLDDSGKELGDTTISDRTRQIEISSSCGSLSARS